MNISRCRPVAWLAALLLFLTGCSLDVESYLRPPRAQGDQQAVQAALDTYIRDTAGTAQTYTLKYPSVGAHTSAFVLCDSHGRPVDGTDANAASMAVVFYAFDTSREETHVNLLRRDGEEWVSVGDSVGYGTEIRQVAFGDLDGDGVAELLTGWSTYNSQNHRLGVFSVTTELTALSTDRVYTQLFAGDLTGEGHDSLLLLHIGNGNKVTATLEALKKNRLREVDTVRLDGFIQQFGDMTLWDMGDGRGLFVDAVKSAGTTITEIICWDGSRLRAPLYDRDSNQTTVTARATGLAARDVDGDGILEVPRCTPLPGFNDENTGDPTAWLTVWRAYDYTADKWEDRLHTVVNTADGYLVTLDDSRRQQTTTRYDATARTLDLVDTETDRVWLRLTAAEDGTGTGDAGSKVALLEATDSLPAVIGWYDPDLLDEEKVRYMLIRL